MQGQSEQDDLDGEYSIGEVAQENDGEDTDPDDDDENISI